MSNLITSWKKFAKKEFSSLNQGVRNLNIILGLKLTASCINQMEKGKKNIPEQLVNYITRLIILKKFKEEKYRMNVVDLEEFLENISLPKRIK